MKKKTKMTLPKKYNISFKAPLTERKIKGLSEFFFFLKKSQEEFTDYKSFEEFYFFENIFGSGRYPIPMYTGDDHLKRLEINFSEVLKLDLSDKGYAKFLNLLYPEANFKME